MKKTPVTRLAIVQFTPNGKCYPAVCRRQDIGVGAKVEIISSDGTYSDGEVVAIQNERWHCTKLQVLHLTSEVEYGFSSDEDNFGFTRTVRSTCAPLYLVR